MFVIVGYIKGHEDEFDYPVAKFNTRPEAEEFMGVINSNRTIYNCDYYVIEEI